MKRSLSRRQAAPPNLAARALRLGVFQHRVEKDPKAYSRKVKHKKGSLPESELPFALGDRTLSGRAAVRHQ